MSTINSNIPDIPFEEIIKYPPPGFPHPSDFKFSPDDKYLTYLDGENNSVIKSLYILDVETKEKTILYSSLSGSEEDLTPTERLRRERTRQRTLGVTYYTWARDVNKIILSDTTGVYGISIDLGIKKTVKIIDFSDKEVIDPQISPDGKWVAYVSEREIFITSFDGKNTKQVTFDAKTKNLSHGVAEYVAQEEMRRMHGFWWSPDSQKIAFTEIDERHIPVFRILHHTKPINDKAAVDEIKYPFTGEKNVYIKLAVVSIHDLQTTWMDLGENKDIYLARVNWFSNSVLTAQIENREQSKLLLVKFDLKTGVQTPILKEESEIWINLSDLFEVTDGENFIWSSERTKFRHLYQYDIQGNLKNAITQGSFIVENIVGRNKEKDLVYVVTTAKIPTEHHLYEYSIQGGKSRQVTKESGLHDITMNHSGSIYIDAFSSIEQAFKVSLRTTDQNEFEYLLFNEKDPRIEKYNLKGPKIVEIPLPDKTILYGAIYYPDESFGPGPFPTIVNLYGGPHPQMVTNGWGMTTNLRIQNLVKRGFVVFIIDNRGSGHRGIEFESVLKGQFGNIEVEDQIFGIQWLIQQGIADKERIGIYGWSYGGYMTLMCLAKAPHIYKVGVAGAPTNDMRDYDTHYTERYLGTPQSNPEGYLQSSVVQHLSGLTGKLMIIQGLIDENVHFKNTAKIINKLTELQKDYSLVLLPESRHGPRKKEERLFIERKMFEFFLQWL